MDLPLAPLAAVLAAYAGGGFNQGAQLLVLAACYHFFFLSRHSYYYGLVAAAGEGTLLAPPEAPSGPAGWRRTSHRPSPMPTLM